MLQHYGLHVRCLIVIPCLVLGEAIAADTALRRGFAPDPANVFVTVGGKGVVNMIVTDLCVFEVVTAVGLVLKELHPGVTLEQVRAKTGCDFQVAL